MRLYEIFSGEELKLAELIQRRRLQLMVHSCIYYELNKNIITDEQWDKWAVELLDLQTKYPTISKVVNWYSAFKDWDASTGVFLPIKDSYIKSRANHLLGIPNKIVTPKQTTKRALF